MKTISIKTAQSNKNVSVVTLADLYQQVTNQKMPKAEYINDSIWLKSDGEDKEAEFFLYPAKTKVSYSDKVTKDDYEGYINYFKLSWNEDKKDWYVYAKVSLRPTLVTLQDDEELGDQFSTIREVLVHRKQLIDLSTDKTLARPDTSSIKSLLKR